MVQAFIGRSSWGFIAFLLALGALAASLIALSSGGTEPRIGIDPLAASSGAKTVDRIKVDAGDKATVFANDDFKVVGTCEAGKLEDVSAEVAVKTKKDGAIIFSTEMGNTEDFLFDTDDPPFEFTSYEASGTTPQYYGYDYYQEFSAESPGGRVTIGRVSNGVHVKNADCVYSGLFID
jgi:hypothetical protein